MESQCTLSRICITYSIDCLFIIAQSVPLVYGMTYLQLIKTEMHYLRSMCKEWLFEGPSITKSKNARKSLVLLTYEFVLSKYKIIVSEVELILERISKLLYSNGKLNPCGGKSNWLVIGRCLSGAKLKPYQKLPLFPRARNVILIARVMAGARNGFEHDLFKQNCLFHNQSQTRINKYWCTLIL